MTLENLLNFVAARTGAIANVQILNAALYDIPTLKLGPRHYYHHGAYCHFAKMNGNQGACHANKLKSIGRARHARPVEPFYGCCPYGVWDYAHPVHVAERCIAVVYLGHFSDAKPLSPMNGQQYAGPALLPITPKRLLEIKQHARFIQQFITYAYEDARRLGSAGGKQMPPSHYQRICEQFIQTHYHEPIRLVDLAKQLNVNPNYLGQLIKSHCGRSFHDMLNRHRVEQAMVHLRSEVLSVTSIAYACGFQDSNYFTAQFHKLTGQTPTAFRRQARGAVTGQPSSAAPMASRIPPR
jgi:AraC-like DNA-binding protein